MFRGPRCSLLHGQQDIWHKLYGRFIKEKWDICGLQGVALHKRLESVPIVRSHLFIRWDPGFRRESLRSLGHGDRGSSGGRAAGARGDATKCYDLRALGTEELGLRRGAEIWGRYRSIFIKYTG